MLVPGAEGYIASFTTEETQCGSVEAPYTLQVAEKQQINITLMDFSYRYCKIAIAMLIVNAIC